MALTTTVDLKLIALLTSALDLSTSQNRLEVNPTYSWESGAGINQANLIFQDQFTLTAGAGNDHDLTALSSSLGAAVSFARVKLIYLRNRSVTAGDNLELGGTVANGITTPFVAANDGVIVGPGGIALLINPSAAGYAVTATTADLLRVENPGANSITYDLVLIGAAT